MLTFLRAVSKSRVAVLARAPSVLSPTTSTLPVLYQRMTACNDKGGKGGKPAKPMTSVCEPDKGGKGEDAAAKVKDQDDECEQEAPPKDDPPKCHESQKKFTQVQQCEEDEEETSCSDSESSESDDEKMPTKECPEEDVKDDEKPPKVASQLCDCTAAAVAKAVEGKKKEVVDKAGKAVEKKVEEVTKKVKSGAPGPCKAPKAKQEVKPKVSEHVKCCQIETGKGSAKNGTKAHIEKCKKMMEQKCDMGDQDQVAEGDCNNEVDPKNAPCACIKQALDKCEKDKAAKPKPKPANVKKPAEKPKPANKQPPSDKKEPPKPDKKPGKPEKKEPCPKPDNKSGKPDKKPCPKPRKTDNSGEKPKTSKDCKKKPTVICK